jgi:hypothetical protein
MALRSHLTDLPIFVTENRRLFREKVSYVILCILFESLADFHDPVSAFQTCDVKKVVMHFERRQKFGFPIFSGRNINRQCKFVTESLLAMTIDSLRISQFDGHVFGCRTTREIGQKP